MGPTASAHTHIQNLGLDTEIGRVKVGTARVKRTNNNDNDYNNNSSSVGGAFSLKPRSKPTAKSTE